MPKPVTLEQYCLPLSPSKGKRVKGSNLKEEVLQGCQSSIFRLNPDDMLLVYNKYLPLDIGRACIKDD
jgi:hypothetical protein